VGCSMYCTRWSAAGIVRRPERENPAHRPHGDTFVEIQRVVPQATAAPRLSFGRAAFDGRHAIHVPTHVVSRQLDLQVRQPIGDDPFRQRLRQPIVHSSSDVSIRQGIERSDQMVQRHPRFRLASVY